MKKEYICIRDYQGGEFGMYRIYTAEQWREQARAWAWQDDWDDAETLLENSTDKEIIDFIIDMWEIELVEVDSEESIKYLEDLKKYYEDREKHITETEKELFDTFLCDSYYFACNTLKKINKEK